MTDEQPDFNKLPSAYSNESQGRASYLSNIAKNTKTRRVEIANMKLMYEEQIEDKN